MTSAIFDRRHFEVSFDRQAWYLAILFLFVQGAAAYLAYVASSAGADVQPPGGVDGPAAGAGLAIAEVAFAALFVGAIIAYFKVPEWIREHVQTVMKIVVAYTAGAYALGNGFFLEGIVLIALVYAVIEGGVWWIVNNVLAVGIAIFGAAVLGLAFNEWMLVVFLVGMAVYDRYFADKKEYMMQMAGVLVKLHIPVLFVKPNTWRFEWTDLLGDEDGSEDGDVDILDDENDSGWGIGTADLMLPAAAVASVATSGTIAFPAAAAAAVAIAVGVSALRIRQKMLDVESGAGLPPITAAVAAAYAVAVVPLTAYAVVVL